MVLWLAGQERLARAQVAGVALAAAGLVSWWAVGEGFGATKLAVEGLAIAGVSLAQRAAGGRSGTQSGGKSA